MRKRLSFVACLCLVAGAGVAVAAAAASGGVRTINPTLRVAVDSTDIDHSDPALAYSLLGWQMEYETCTTLVGYADAGGTKVGTALTPTGAKGWPVISNHGKTYVFTIRSGMRFSNGDPVTAANYKYAFDRDALKNLNSPATAFTVGVKGWTAENNDTNIRAVSGVVADGMTLTIHLTARDETLLPKLAMPFFCPLDKTAPFYVGGKWVDSEVKEPYPAAGPYYLATRNVGTDMVLQRNPYYAGARPRQASTIQIDMNKSLADAYNGISNGTYAADLNGNPKPSNNQQLAKKFGINKSRFRVEPTLIVTYLAMNESRQIFKSVGVRKGVNYALDRPGVIESGGYLSASPTVQILPKLLTGGVWSTTLYPTTSPGAKQFAMATQVSNDCGLGHTQPLYFLHGSSSPALAAAAVIKSDLQQMGCANIVDEDEQTCAYGCRGGQPPYDIRTAYWADDYPDGYQYLGLLLDGRLDKNDPYYTNDLSHFDNAAYNKRLDRANALIGRARAKAFGELDQWVMKKYAPLAPVSDINFVDYLSPNAHGYVYNGPLSSVDLGDLYQS